MSTNRNHSNKRTRSPLSPLHLRDYVTLVLWSFFQPVNIQKYLKRAGIQIEPKNDFDFRKQFRRNPVYRNLIIMSGSLLGLVILMWPLLTLSYIVVSSTPPTFTSEPSLIFVIRQTMLAIFLFAAPLVGIWITIEMLIAFLSIGRGQEPDGLRKGRVGRWIANGIEHVLSIILATPKSNPFWRLQHHPIIWDDLLDTRLARSDQLLLHCFRSNFDRTMRLVLKIIEKRSQRRVMGRCLAEYLNLHSNPLEIIYRLAYSPSLSRLKLAFDDEHDNNIVSPKTK